MTSDETTIALEAYGLSMTATPGPTNEEEYTVWPHDSWTVSLTFEGRTFITPFKMGKGRGGAAPELSEVVHNVVSTAQSCGEGQTFEEWAADFGYDVDSRKAEAEFRACVEQSERFREFLGSPHDFEAVSLLVEGL